MDYRYAYSIPKEEEMSVDSVLRLGFHSFVYGSINFAPVIRTDADPETFRKIRGRAACLRRFDEDGGFYFTEEETRDGSYVQTYMKYFGKEKPVAGTIGNPDPTKQKQVEQPDLENLFNPGEKKPVPEKKYYYAVEKDEEKVLADFMRLTFRRYAFGQKRGVRVVEVDADPDEFRKIRGRASCLKKYLEYGDPCFTQEEEYMSHFMSAYSRYCGNDETVSFIIEGFDEQDPV